MHSDRHNLLPASLPRVKNCGRICRNPGCVTRAKGTQPVASSGRTIHHRTEHTGGNHARAHDRTHWATSRPTSGEGEPVADDDGQAVGALAQQPLSRAQMRKFQGSLNNRRITTCSVCRLGVFVGHNAGWQRSHPLGIVHAECATGECSPMDTTAVIIKKHSVDRDRTL